MGIAGGCVESGVSLGGKFPACAWGVAGLRPGAPCGAVAPIVSPGYHNPSTEQTAPLARHGVPVHLGSSLPGW